MHFRELSLHLFGLAALTLATACNNNGGDDSSGSSSGGSTASAAETGSETGVPATSTGTATTGAAASTGTGDEPTSTTGTTGAAETGTTGAAETGSESTGSGDTTAAAPTDGPGLLPGEEGLDAMCRRYVECGGTYYADQQGCLDATYDYWGDCPSRKAALDLFGACMSELGCDEWSPDAYNPADTPCAREWSGVGEADPCG